MARHISATEVVREFSELLNNVKYRRERYTILRGGKPAAAFIPVEEAVLVRRMADLTGIIESLPRLDPGDTGFAADVLEMVKDQPPLPGETKWA
jgi:antitoxin (DNA-binding transcriptional repressor) of toxin-antitoxin stability system